MTILATRKAKLLVATSLIAVSAHHAALAEVTASPSFNAYGAPGLLDMPSAEKMEDGYLTLTSAHWGPISRTTLSFQISPRLSASFRFLGIRDWSACNPGCNVSDEFETYYDRSFDLRYHMLDEGRYRPAVTIGLQDFAGTGVLSGEYIVATKTVTPRLKVTAGLGWGRLGSHGSIGSPFGARPKPADGFGGEANFEQWFRGNAAPFAGLEWKLNDKISLKAEYSSDDYSNEDERRDIFEQRSHVNLGIDYRLNEYFQLSGYYMYGSELGFAAHFIMNPKQRPMGSIKDGAPDPIKVRPSRLADPEAYSTDWVTQADAAPILMTNLNKRLKADGLVVESISYDGAVAQVRFRNTRYDAEAQAIGRLARAMSHAMPESVETFEIVPMADGLPVSRVILRRSDLERLEGSSDAAEAMYAAAKIANPGPTPALTYNPDLFPDFTWAVTPYNRIRLFDQRGSPFKMDVGARFSMRYEFSPGWVLEGAAVKKVLGNLSKLPPTKPTLLPPVRSDVERYDANGDPAVERLTLSRYGHLGGDFYGRFSAGYLERMHAGVSAEVLYKPVDSKWAIGAEANYTKQRDSDGLFGFSEYDYSVATGHISAYYSFSKGYNAQLDVGRYLAGDIGATLTLEREFASGWRIGAFATKTNVSAEEFGSGSFDKGITLEVPLSWGTGRPGRTTYATTIRPFGRDGGARLEVSDRLHDVLRDYDAAGIEAQWGRFWK